MGKFSQIHTAISVATRAFSMQTCKFINYYDLLWQKKGINLRITQHCTAIIGTVSAAKGVFFPGISTIAHIYKL